MAKAGLLGGSKQQKSLPFDAQRSINFFPILDEQGADVGSLYGTPGLKPLGTAGIGPGRKAFSASNGRAFSVIGSGLYELMANGSSNLLGSLDQSQGICTIAENGLQLAVCDGQSLYILTYATNVFGKVVNSNLPSAGTVTFIGGYFVVNRSTASGIYQISGLYDGYSWAALDFATAESSPDALLAVLYVAGQLWLLGARSIEIAANTGALSFPFEPISGARIETGIISPYACISLDNSLFWVGTDINGSGIVYRADGFSPQRISTETQERIISKAADPGSIRIMAYQEEGHTFLIVTGGGMETSQVYDLATQLWHERAYLNDDGNYELHLNADIMFAFGQHVSLDRRNGNFYSQSLNYYSDNGDEIASDRIFTHIIDENKRIKYPNLTVNFETGVGNQIDPGSDPQATLFISNDGGRTWPISLPQSIGKVGQYLKRVTWYRLGQARIRTFRIRITDPVKRCITGAYFNG